MNPPPASALGVEDAFTLFGPPVTRVMLNWDLLCRSNVQVTTEAVTGGLWARLSTPWYVDRQAGQEVSYLDGAGRPVMVSEVPQRLGALAPERAPKMAAIAASWTSDTAPWMVLCYAVGDVWLVLDGNHRLSASVVHGLDARAVAVVLRGPVDPSVLPDLAAFI